MGLSTIVFYGSVREARQGIRVARFVIRALQDRGHDVTFFDALELKLPLLDKRMLDYKSGEAPAHLQALSDQIRAADGFVVVTGEYNGSIPPALSNMLDYFLAEYKYRPSAIVSYATGAFGGVRAAVVVRSMLSVLGCTAIPTTQPVPNVRQSFAEDGAPLDQGLADRFPPFFAEFEWYAEALKAQRAKGLPA